MTNTVGIQITYKLTGPTRSQCISATSLQKRHLLTSYWYATMFTLLTARRYRTQKLQLVGLDLAISHCGVNNLIKQWHFSVWTSAFKTTRFAVLLLMSKHATVNTYAWMGNIASVNDFDCFILVVISSALPSRLYEIAFICCNLLFWPASHRTFDLWSLSLLREINIFAKSKSWWSLAFYVEWYEVLYRCI